MKDYTAESIRNIAVAGHAGSGKTTLAESLLFTAGASDRLGRTSDAFSDALRLISSGS